MGVAVGRCGSHVGHYGAHGGDCGSLWVAVGRYGCGCGSLWVAVGPYGSRVGLYGSLWVPAPQDDQLLDDAKTLGDCGFTSQTARPQAPATVGLALRSADECFEALRIDAFSSPPELPDVMKPQDSTGGANETPVQ
uniref:Elongin B n=1 Tax=Anas zonorhyncha TaxID=75864 RepID=A0A8B9VMS8_9AVES